ncbi:MAG: CPBP family glutamic-type intramembrane protease, partial [Bryocella sp.]
DDVDAVPYNRMSIAGICVSSILFGAMHGKVWYLGIVAGIFFALAAKWKNRLGEAVAAHAVANGIIAIVALFLHDYSLW